MVPINEQAGKLPLSALKDKEVEEVRNWSRINRLVCVCVRASECVYRSVYFQFREN